MGTNNKMFEFMSFMWSDKKLTLVSVLFWSKNKNIYVSITPDLQLYQVLRLIIIVVQRTKTVPMKYVKDAEINIWDVFYC